MVNLNPVAEQAALLLVERHRAELSEGEVIRVFLTRHKGLRRVALELEDFARDGLLDLFADIPGTSERDDEEADLAAVALGLDFLDGVLAEYFRLERQALPRLEPEPHLFEGRSIHLSGSLRRPGLETAADSFLKDHEGDCREED